MVCVQIFNFNYSWLSWFIGFNATFNNIPDISLRSVLLMEDPEKTTDCRKGPTNFIT